MKTSLPEVLAPGESATLAFSVTAPMGGVREWQVPLLAEGYDTPVGIVRGRITVPVTPPYVMESPSTVTWVRSAGSHQKRSIVIRTLEAPDEERWIQQVRIEPEIAAVERFTWQDRPDLSGLILRAYDVELQSAADTEGLANGLLHFEVSGDDADAALPAIPLQIDTRPRYAVFPPELVLDRAEHRSRTVVLLDRAASDPGEQYDMFAVGANLELARVDDEPRKFQVALPDDGDGEMMEREPVLRFVNASGETVATVPVRIPEAG